MITLTLQLRSITLVKYITISANIHIGKHQKSMESYNEALRFMKQVLEKLPQPSTTLGLVHLQCCRYDKALKVFKGALKLQREAREMIM